MSDQPFFEFEVSLRDIAPRIWRRFLLKRSATFEDLHRAIQDSFDWLDYHLWAFSPEDMYSSTVVAGSPQEPEWQDEAPIPDGARVKLASYFAGPAARFRGIYTYDYGDDWEHEVQLVQMTRAGDVRLRKLLGGERNRPPEDCGGVGGYEQIIEFLRTGRQPDPHVDLGGWLGDWKPETFDFAAVRARFDR